MKDKKGQEEMIGFIMIVLLVVVIILVLLGISVRSGPSQGVKSTELSQFVDSLLNYNTECATNIPTDFLEVRRLALECYENPSDKCLSGENVCDVLDNTIDEILSTSIQIGGVDRPRKGAILEINYSSGGVDENILRKEILEGEGVCKGDFGGVDEPLFKIRTTFIICY